MFIGIAAKKAAQNESRIKQLRREKMKEVAKELFRTQGIQETTMQQIADLTGTGRRTIYHYYETKEEIAIEIQQEYLACLQSVEGFEAVKARTSTGIRRVEEMLDCLLDHYLNHADKIQYLHEFDRIFRQADGYAYTTMRLEEYPVYQSLKAAMEQGIADGTIRPMPEEEINKSILTICHALIALIDRITVRPDIFRKIYHYDVADIRLFVRLCTQGLRNEN